MVLRYSDKPVVNYGSDRPLADDWRNRFPAHARPIATAPERGGGSVIVYEPTGEAHRAVFYKGQWQKLESVRDPYTGTTRLRMDGTAVMNPVMWASS